MTRGLCCSVLIALTCAAQHAGAGDSTQMNELRAKITVEPGRLVGDVPPRLYGGLMELIGENFSGGLNAELLRNRKFANVTDLDGEGTPFGWRPIAPREKRGPLEYVTSYNSIVPGAWACSLFATGAEIQTRGVCQDHIALQAGRAYVLSFYLRAVAQPPEEISASLADEAGREEMVLVSKGEEFGRGWRKYTYRCAYPRTTPNGELRIRTKGAGGYSLAAVSLMPEENFEGFRADMVAQLRGMGLALLRFPGGCAAEAYDWRRAIGPRDKRLPWLNRAWANYDDMDTGTDEICRLAEAIGAEVQMTVNISTLSEDVAAQWVEYCNGGPETRWGKVRAENGHPKPYNVKLWGLGNEANTFGFPCEHTPEEYADICNHFMAAMLNADPSIQFVLVGNEPQPLPGHPDWDQTLFKKIDRPYACKSVHLYTFIPLPSDLAAMKSNPVELATACAAAPRFLESELSRIYHHLEQGMAGKPLPSLHFEEWGLLEGRPDWKTDPADLPDAYNLRGALFVAGTMNALLRLCDKVGAANIVYPTGSQFVFRDGNNVHVTPAATAFGLHRRFCGQKSYAPRVECPVFDHPAMGSIPAQKNVPVLDVAATTGAQGRLALLCINRSPDSAVTAEIDVAGFSVGGKARVYQINRVDGFGDLSAWYDAPARDGVGQRDRRTVPTIWTAPKLPKIPRTHVEELPPIIIDKSFEFEFPPYSFTVIACEGKGTE